MEKINPRLIKSFNDIVDSEFFLPFATEEYIKAARIEGTLIDQQIKIAVALEKPVLMAFEKSVPEPDRVWLRSRFPVVSEEVEFDKEQSESFKVIADRLAEMYKRKMPKKEDDED